MDLPIGEIMTFQAVDLETGHRYIVRAVIRGVVAGRVVIEFIDGPQDGAAGVLPRAKFHRIENGDTCQWVFQP